MIGAGTVINPIIKIVTTVAILAAVGFFIVRPILDTTENAINSVSEGVRNAAGTEPPAERRDGPLVLAQPGRVVRRRAAEHVAGRAPGR